MPSFLIIRATDQHVMTRATSTEEAQNLANAFAYEYGEKFFFKPEPDLHWRNREERRFIAGEYKYVPWMAESWWTHRSDEMRDHFTHRSSEKPEMIAFTESPEKGELDRQTRMRAGAYLQKYFSDYLTDTEIASWARAMARLLSDDTPALQIASTPEHIRDVYLNGPESCMSYEIERYVSRPYHPVDVYGDSDLAVAYVERKSDYHTEKYASRALIWPEEKIYGRVYPTPERYHGVNREIAKQEYDSLIRSLESVGYKAGKFEGAKIRAIRHKTNSDEFVMPYLDGHQGVTLSHDEEHFIIARNGDFSAQNTHGTISTSDMNRCENCDESCEEDYTYSVNTGSYSTQSWCECCVNNSAFYCHGTEEHFDESEFSSVSVNDETYSLRYAQRNFNECARSGDWFFIEDTRTVHTSSGPEIWCEDETYSHAFFCHLTEEYYAEDDFESVEIDGETYEESAARDDLILSAKLREMETEETE